ncbi:hypothetical protein DL93DRAFT_2102170 [Clavulina sp. PMI_390]|nr:hypothetical protein DL93DRAFT_2102170 [Clavulina sp. PMI_390]
MVLPNIRVTPSTRSPHPIHIALQPMSSSPRNSKARQQDDVDEMTPKSTMNLTAHMESPMTDEGAETSQHLERHSIDQNSFRPYTPSLTSSRNVSRSVPFWHSETNAFTSTSGSSRSSSSSWRAFLCFPPGLFPPYFSSRNNHSFNTLPSTTVTPPTPTAHTHPRSHARLSIRVESPSSSSGPRPYDEYGEPPTTAEIIIAALSNPPQPTSVPYAERRRSTGMDVPAWISGGNRGVPKGKERVSQGFLEVGSSPTSSASSSASPRFPRTGDNGGVAQRKARPPSWVAPPPTFTLDRSAR